MQRLISAALGLSMLAPSAYVLARTAPATTRSGATSAPAKHATTATSHPTTTASRATSAPAVAASQPAVPEAPQTPNSALAERLTETASVLLRTHHDTPAIWQYGIALLKSAMRLAPDEPRYARFLIEAAQRSGDSKEAIKAINDYRKLDPNDEFAQLQLIDLYLAQMQASDQRANYLKAIVGSDRVPPGVRSMAALRLCRVYAERMENEQSADALEQALKFNPLNLEAQRLRFAWMPPQAPADRCRAEMTMLLANPVQPQVIAGIARDLAGAGMVGRSLEWFTQVMELQNRLEYPPPSDIGVDYAAELLISGDPHSAAQLAEGMTSHQPDDLNAWLMRLIAAKAASDKDGLAKTIKEANVALANRLAVLAQAAGDKTATTRPVDTSEAVELPDPRALLDRLQSAKKPELVAQFAPVAGGVAWLRIYFENKPGSAMPWVQALASVAKGKDAEETLARLQGWAFLTAGNKDDARVKLQAVADRDPIAALGLIQIDADKDKAKAEKEADKLLQANPSGLTGAQLCQALSGYNLKIKPGPASAQLEKLLSDFPRDFMKIIDQPQKFYDLRADPVRVAVPVGEPVLVRVTVNNISNYPLTVGPEGVIHQDLWLDAQLRGVSPRTFPAEAYQRLGGSFVLMPKQSVEQVVRLDQNQLAAALESNPRSSFQIGATVITNPTTMNGQIRIGPCGARASMGGLIERQGLPIGSEDVRQKLMDTLDSGSPEEKARAVDVLSRFAALLSGQPDAPTRQLAIQCVQAVRRAIQDDDPTVASFASFRYAMLTRNSAMIDQMLHDPFWLTRVYGITLVDDLGLDRGPVKKIASSDSDPLVKSLAEASMHAGLKPPSTQPATQPAAAP
jgi:tetratricopeptide (TPR) repeat protein